MKVLKNFMLSGISVLGQGISTYAHEWGHAKAIEALYENAQPIIQIRSWIFGGGQCSYNRNYTDLNPSFLGSRFSKETRYGIVSTMGPVVDYINITSSLIASWKLRNKCNWLAILLASHALIKSERTFYNYTQDKSDYYYIAKNLPVPDASLCILTATTTLISGIWLSYLIFRNPVPNVAYKQD